MYNVVFDSESGRQNPFNDKNPIICMIVHEFKLNVLDMHLFYSEFDSVVESLVDEDIVLHHIPEMNTVKFADEAFAVLMKYHTDSAVTGEAFEPLIMSGSFYATDTICKALNTVFTKNRKILKEKELDLSADTMLAYGFMSFEHCEKIVDTSFKTINSKDFEPNLTGQCYLKALVSYPGKK